MSAATDVDALHGDFRAHVQETLPNRLGNLECSVAGQQMRALERRGAQDWYEHSIECLVYFATELCISPPNHSNGTSVKSITSAMHDTIQALV
jgi:hypothetical protein